MPCDGWPHFLGGGSQNMGVGLFPQSPPSPLPGLWPDILVEISVNNLGHGSSPGLLRDGFSDTLLSVSRFHPRVLRGKLMVSGLQSKVKGLTPPHQVPRVGVGLQPIPSCCLIPHSICSCLGASGRTLAFTLLPVPSLPGLLKAFFHIRGGRLV